MHSSPSLTKKALAALLLVPSSKMATRPIPQAYARPSPHSYKHKEETLSSSAVASCCCSCRLWPVCLLLLLLLPPPLPPFVCLYTPAPPLPPSPLGCSHRPARSAQDRRAPPPALYPLKQCLPAYTKWSPVAARPPAVAAAEPDGPAAPLPPTGGTAAAAPAVPYRVVGAPPPTPPTPPPPPGEEREWEWEAEGLLSRGDESRSPPGRMEARQVGHEALTRSHSSTH